MWLVTFILFVLGYIIIGFFSYYVIRTIWYHGLPLPDDESDKCLVVFIWPFLFLFIIGKNLWRFLDLILKCIFYIPQKISTHIMYKSFLKKMPDLKHIDYHWYEAMSWITNIISTCGNFDERENVYRLEISGYVDGRWFHHMSVNADKDYKSAILCSEDRSFISYNSRTIDWLSSKNIIEVCEILADFLKGNIK